MDSGMRRNNFGKTAAANTATPAERNRMLGTSNTDGLLPDAPFGASQKPSPGSAVLLSRPSSRARSGQTSSSPGDAQGRVDEDLSRLTRLPGGVGRSGDGRCRLGAFGEDGQLRRQVARSTGLHRQAGDVFLE